MDLTFPDMFGVQTLEGDLQATLGKPDEIALTTKAAERLFGNAHALGKSMQIEGKNFLISAILKDPPSTTTVAYEALAGINTAVFSDEDRKFIMNAWSNIGGKIYIKLAPGIAPESLQKILQDAGDNSPFAANLPIEQKQQLGQKKLIDIRLSNLKDVYFDTYLSNSPGNLQGDKKTLFGLAIAAALILLLAATNYVNLAIVRTLRRHREIGMYKMLGASTARIIGQFLSESVLVAMIATALGLLLTWLFIPTFSLLVNRPLDNVFTPATLCASAVLGLMVGLAAGAYPTWVAVCINANQALAGRGTHESAGGLWLRRVLTVLQFSTAMAFVAISMAITWQTNYSSQLNLGFDPEPLLVLRLNNAMSDPASINFRDALLRLPGIQGVAASSHPVGRDFIGFNTPIKQENGNTTSVNVQNISANFFDVHLIKALAGRMFNPQIDPSDNAKVTVLNAAAARALGFESAQAAIGQSISFVSRTGQKSLQIVGISPNIRYQSARENEQPRMYLLNLAQGTLTIRTDGDFVKAESQIGALWQQHFPNDVFDIQRSVNLIAQNYQEDRRLAQLLTAASALAIIIAAFGIYVLSDYSVRRQEKEIALRKLYGASTRAIGMLVAKEILSLMVLSALIGLTIGAFAISRHLSGFVERAPIGAWTLLMAFGISLLIAFISTLRHSLVALRIAPAIILRN